MIQLTIATRALDAATRGRPVIDELIVGSILVLIVNYLVLTFLFKKKKNIRLHVFVMLWSALAFLINVYLKGNPMKMPLTLVHTISFIAVYYFALFKDKDEKGFKWFIPGFFLSVFYILSVMVFEGIYRSIVHIGDITMLINDPSGTMQKYIVMLPIAAVMVALSYLIYRLMKNKSKKS